MEGANIVVSGFIIVLIGIAVIIIGSLLSAGKGETKFAVGGFVGPIPFGFGNDERLTQFSIVLAFFMFVIILMLASRGMFK